MTEPEPTPAFRSPADHGRALTGFPWVQLVFCLACLAMAAWTWMRDTRTALTTENTEYTEGNVRQDPMFSVISVPSVVRFDVRGLAVGAMGCFIFGLYLRRWLGERKALAGDRSRGLP